MTFEKIRLNTKPEEKSNEKDNTTSSIEISGTPQEQRENTENMENAESLINAEQNMLEELFQEKIMTAIEQESEKYEEDHKIERPVEDEDANDEEQKQKNIESAGISSLINKIPTRAKRFINAMTMASIIAGGISVSMIPSTAEAGGNTYSWKEQVDDYRKAYREEKQRIRKMDTARHKAKQAAAKARTRQSIKRLDDRRIENRQMKSHITHDARHAARGDDVHGPSAGKVIADFLYQMLNEGNQDNQQEK